METTKKNNKTVDKIEWFDADMYYLSNFSEHQFVEPNGARWKTNEHFYQAAKTTHPFHRWRIWAAESPGQAKYFGKQAPLISNWDDRKMMVMLAGLKMKFQQNEDIAKKLLSTKGYVLIEGNNWHDNYWGDCRCEKCNHLEGQNYLGLLLMVVRDKIL